MGGMRKNGWPGEEAIQALGIEFEKLVVCAHATKDGKLVYVVIVGTNGGVVGVWDIEGLEDG